MQEWDKYWAKDQLPHNRIYDKISVFYRKYIIKPYLKQYLTKFFPEKSIVLHAGCGGGQVEEGITHSIWNIGLDISANALALYKSSHEESNIIQGDIFAIGIKNESLDGIYNLGVMEHFEREDIAKILREFNRVLRKHGIIILFWPPKYGVSVIFLALVHYCFISIFKKNIKLHPSEPSLIKSRKTVKKMMNEAGFTLKEINFSLTDFYTYMVIVAEKK